MSEPEPVTRKLEAAKVLFRSAHALEAAIEALQAPFAPSLIEVLSRLECGPRTADLLDEWRLKLVVAGNALIDDAIHEELEQGEARYIAEAVRAQIRDDRVTFPPIEPPTET